MRTWCYLIGLAQFPICNFLYSQFPIPALFWPCCGMRLFTELGFSKFNLRKVFPLNSLFKFLLNGKYDNQDLPQCTHFQWKSVLLFFCNLAFQPKARQYSQYSLNILFLIRQHNIARFSFFSLFLDAIIPKVAKQNLNNFPKERKLKASQWKSH